MSEIGELIRVNGYSMRVVWSLKKCQSAEPSWAWKNPPAGEVTEHTPGAIWDRENDCWVLPK